MDISPLAMGLVTGAVEINDSAVEEAVVELLANASRDEVVQALMDMTGLVVALSRHTDYQISTLLEVVST
jgi:hypothetical protein